MFVPKFPFAMTAVKSTVNEPEGNATAAETVAWWKTSTARALIYALVLIAVGSPLCFHHLNRGMLLGDEAAFARSADLMRASGDWVVPTLDGYTPHLNAAPLYVWLCCITIDLTDDSPLRYRLWSAIFGVLCGVAVLLLGAELFTPEVGFAAGLLLLTNQHFQFHHGAHEGVMEPGLLFFHTLMIACYARANRSGSDCSASAPVRHYFAANLWWILAGVCLGGALLMKPPAMGGFFFTLMTLHHLLSRRDLPLSTRITRPLLALAAATVIALPWYGLLVARLGPGSLKTLVLFNSIGRTAAHGAHEKSLPSWTYLRFAWDSSRSGRLFWPALGVGTMCAILGWRRLGWGLPAILAGVYTLAVSSAATKSSHYIYNAFPYLCILTAATVLFGWLYRPADNAGRWAWWCWRGLRAAGIVAMVFLVQADCRRMSFWWPLLQPEYPPMVVERAIRSRGEEETCRLILYRYPQLYQPGEPRDSRAWVDSSAEFYQTRLTLAHQAMDVETLNHILADGRPAIVFLPPGHTLADLERGGLVVRPDRTFGLRTRFALFPVLVFHGAESALGLEGFFHGDEVPSNTPDPI